MNRDSYNISDRSDLTLNLEEKFPSGKKTHPSPLNTNRISYNTKERNLKEHKAGFPARKRHFEKGKMKKSFKQGFYVSSGRIDNTNNLISRGDITKPLTKTQKIRDIARRMVSLVQNKLLFGSAKFLRKYHYDIINDHATSFDDSDANKKFKSDDEKNHYMNKGNLNAILQRYALSKFEEVLSLKIKVFDFIFPLINPNHLWKIIWDLFIFFCVFIKFIWTTVELSFEVDFRYSIEFKRLNIALFVLVFIDAFISLNTVYFREGTEITDRRKITIHYLQKNFFPDVLVMFSVCTNLFFENHENIYCLIDLLVIFKLQKFFETEERLKPVLIHNIRAESLYKIFGLISKIFLVAHLLACSWHYIGYRSSLENQENKTWLLSKGIVNEKWLIKYLYSIYWGITTMLTVGYGDITPSNTTEILFNICAMLLGCGIFGYSMNYIGDILTSAGQSDRLLKEQLDQVTRILRKKKLPQELQTRVLKYLEFIWKQEISENPQQENLLMNKLSSKLRDEVYLHTNVQYLKNVKTFRIFYDKTLIKIASLMKKIRLSPEEFVFKIGDRDESSVYFIIDGKLELLKQKNICKDLVRNPLQHLEKNEYFGLHELFSGDERKSSVLSLDFSSLFQLTRNDFLSVMKEDPEEYEKFCRLKDELILYNQVKHFDIECASCFMNDHRVEDCKFFRYSPNHLKVIGSYNLRIKNFEKEFERKNYERISTLALKNRLEITSEELHNTYKDDEEFANLTRLYSESKFGLEEIERFESNFTEENEKTNRSAFRQKRDWRGNSEFLRQRFIEPGKLSPDPKMANLKDKGPEEDEGFDKIRSFQHYYLNNNIENIIINKNKKRRRLDLLGQKF